MKLIQSSSSQIEATQSILAQFKPIQTNLIQMKLIPASSSQLEPIEAIPMVRQ
jgi:hypothetical protein